MDISASELEEQKRISIFFCYAREDEILLSKLKNHLQPLRRQGLIELWYDREIRAGSEWEPEIKKKLDTAHIILLLVSPDFIASDYCYGIEMKRALERHQHGEATVIPIILRDTYWHGEPLGKLQALPTDGKPVTSRVWGSQDEALYTIVVGVRDAVEAKRQLQAEEQIRRTEEERRHQIEEAERIRAEEDWRCQSEEERDRQTEEAKQLQAEEQAHSIEAARIRKVVEEGQEHLVVEEGQEHLVEKEKRSNLDPTNLTLIRTLVGHSGTIRAIAFSFDGHILASSSSDTTIKIWNPSTGELLHTLSGHEGNVSSIALSLDGRVIASGGDDNTILLWDTSTGKKLHALSQHTKRIFCVSFSPDSHTLVSSSQDDTIKFWNPSTGELFHSLNEGRAFCLAFSPSGQFLASGKERNVCLTDFSFLHSSIGTWSPLLDTTFPADVPSSAFYGMTYPPSYLFQPRPSHSDKVLYLAFSPDGQFLASGSSDETIKLWNLSSLERSDCLVAKHSISCLTFSPDSKFLAFCCDNSFNGGFTMKFWDISTNERFDSSIRHTEKISAIAFSPHRQIIASGGDDKIIKIWGY